MIRRYANLKIEEIFSDQQKLAGWQRVELALLQAKVKLGRLGSNLYESIKVKLEATPFDVEWWRVRDKAIHHDLNAALEERMRHLDPDEQVLYREILGNE